MTTTAFSTVINCMDGRTQLPVLAFMVDRFQTPFVDTITAAGPVKLVAMDDSGSAELADIHNRIAISIEKHGSQAIAVVAHHDCAGNPVPEDRQRTELEQAVSALKARYKTCTILGLWVDAHWTVHELN